MFGAEHRPCNQPDDDLNDQTADESQQGTQGDQSTKAVVVAT
jgi:hypothetical protein